MSNSADCLRDCQMVLSRFVTKSGFKALRDLFDVDGGGQRWVTLGSDERILRFFNIADKIEEFCDGVDGDYNAALDTKLEDLSQNSVSFGIDIEPIDEIDVPESEVHLKYTVSRPWQIPVTPPHELWVNNDYVPTVDDFGGLDLLEDNYYTSDSQCPPMIYFIKDNSGKFHTRTVRGVDATTIGAYPALVQECWNRYVDASGERDNTAFVDFCQNEVTTL